MKRRVVWPCSIGEECKSKETLRRMPATAKSVDALVSSSRTVPVQLAQKHSRILSANKRRLTPYCPIFKFSLFSITIKMLLHVITIGSLFMLEGKIIRVGNSAAITISKKDLEENKLK